MRAAIEKIQDALQEYITAKDDPGNQGMLNSFILVHEAVNMADVERTTFGYDYITGGPGCTPANNKGLLEIGMERLAEDMTACNCDECRGDDEG